MTTTPESCDFIFIGMGASASLLLYSLEKRELMEGKKLVVIDPAAKRVNDKTFCFWSKDTDAITQDLSHLISHRWYRIRHDNTREETLAPYAYHHINSLDLYEMARGLISRHEVEWVSSRVEQVASLAGQTLVHTAERSYAAPFVFDSRPPEFEKPAPNQAHLHQSFVGWKIKLDRALLDAKTFDMMDFSVSQDGFTQFVYVLPYSESEALVELTRFGEATLDYEKSMVTLDAYITKRFGAYQIEETETGCIPMCSAPRLEVPKSGTIRLGGRAGMIKPSTGYAFKNMYRHAEELAANLSMQKPIVEPVRGVPSRFDLYDRLLLMILRFWPHWGKRIFQRLFSRRPAAAVFDFLDEKTTLAQDARLFSTLPLRPFLLALGLDIATQLRQQARPVGMLCLSAVLLLLYHYTPGFAQEVAVVLLLAGLALIGIPHGAVDHLLETRQLSGGIRPAFVFGYLGLGGLLFAVWMIMPTLALVFFLAYSALHFGQADLREWRIPSRFNLRAFAWGTLVLSVLLLGHVEEANEVLQQLGAPEIPKFVAGLPSVDWAFYLLGLGFLWAVSEASWGFSLSLAMLALTNFLPLLPAFGLYFIGQHSLNGWSHLKRGMRVNDLTLFTKALPFNAGAWLLLIGFYAWMWHSGMETSLQTFAPPFFVFLSCLSFPHVVAMHRYYQHQEAE
jgi:lycopene beta-cyclase